MVATQLDLSVLSTAAVLNNSGLALHTQGLHFEALEKFQAALGLEPNNPIIFNNCGVCYFSLDLFEDAIQSYKLATDLEPRKVRNYEFQHLVWVHHITSLGSVAALASAPCPFVVTLPSLINMACV